MNKNTCDLGVISHCRAGSGHSTSSFVSAWLFEPRGQKPANSIINTTWIFQAILVCGQHISIANTLRFVMLEDVTITHNAVNQLTCNPKMLVNFSVAQSTKTKNKCIKMIDVHALAHLLQMNDTTANHFSRMSFFPTFQAAISLVLISVIDCTTADTNVAYLPSNMPTTWVPDPACSKSGMRMFLSVFHKHVLFPWSTGGTRLIHPQPWDWILQSPLLVVILAVGWQSSLLIVKQSKTTNQTLSQDGVAQYNIFFLWQIATKLCIITTNYTPTEFLYPCYKSCIL